ncbi:flagellar hook-length control protein FliK [Cohnella sp. GCM10020058]|uniref:flagellar hook-length control protein FliK n=1 Tax=Cohnella sp. GCM10020058 TaxID=3317330 RepID=UPI003624C114
MNIQSTNAASSTNAGGAGASKATAAGGIFQGVLVQKIDAAGPADGKNAAAPNQTAGLLGMLSAALMAPSGESADAASSEGETQLAQMLDGLEEKLAQVGQDDQTSDSMFEKMAELLANLQAMLQQNASQSQQVGNLTGAGDFHYGTTIVDSPAEQIQAAILLPALSDAIKNLRSIMKNGQMSTTEMADASTAIQRALQTGQTDVMKVLPAFKEPVVYWNLHSVYTQGESSSSEQEKTADAGVSTEDQSLNLNWQSISKDAEVKTDLASSVKQQGPATVPAHQFAEEMNKFLVKQFKLTGGNGISEANINLHPEHLGEVQIRLTMQNGILNAQFVTHNEAAKEMLENQMAQLRGSLQNQGIQIERVEVVQQQQQTADSPSFMNQEQRRQQTGGGEAKRSTDGVETLEEFEEELERSATLREAGFGGALNVTA